MKYMRRKLLIDKDVQLGLVVQLAIHWMMFLAATVCVLPIARAIILADVNTPPWDRFKGAGTDTAILFVVFLLLFPYFMYDSIKVTNRFAGPMYRLKVTIRALASGAPFHGLHFRVGDYWQDVAKDFNTMMARIGAEKPCASQNEETSPATEVAEVASV